MLGLLTTQVKMQTFKHCRSLPCDSCWSRPPALYPRYWSGGHEGRWRWILMGCVCPAGGSFCAVSRWGRSLAFNGEEWAISARPEGLRWSGVPRLPSIDPNVPPLSLRSPVLTRQDPDLGIAVLAELSISAFLEDLMPWKLALVPTLSPFCSLTAEDERGLPTFHTTSPLSLFTAPSSLTAPATADCYYRSHYFPSASEAPETFACQ